MQKADVGEVQQIGLDLPRLLLRLHLGLDGSGAGPEDPHGDAGRPLHEVAHEQVDVVLGLRGVQVDRPRRGRRSQRRPATSRADPRRAATRAEPEQRHRERRDQQMPSPVPPVRHASPPTYGPAWHGRTRAAYSFLSDARDPVPYASPGVKAA